VDEHNIAFCAIKLYYTKLERKNETQIREQTAHVVTVKQNKLKMFNDLKNTQGQTGTEATCSTMMSFVLH